ncbi:hypothetical protein BGZ94_010418 [Podila epigama]|nr:hypothetical protein BGZ94_010418 [Podila epigama]
MDRDTTKILAAVTIGLGLATLAYRASQPPKKPGRGTWKAKKDMTEYDYIILGGGTAGCVLASRLSEDPNVRVLVLEAGDDHDENFAVKTPMLCSMLYGTDCDWQLKTVPQVHANNRVLNQIRGKLLGGSSSLNGMMYTRGPSSDFDRWADKFENPGWSYENVLPYFKKSECFHDASLPADHPRGLKTQRTCDPDFDTFEPEYHGTEGPWSVLHQQHLYGSAKGFIRANEKEGVMFNKDINGSSSLGAFRQQQFIQPDAVRASASRAFLGNNKNPSNRNNRPNLRIVLKTHVEKIIIENINGVKTAVGAVFRDEKNVRHKVYATREVLLSAGVFNSPPILLASGIGQKIHESIPLIHHLPGVGQNLSDHMGVGIVYNCPMTTDTCQRILGPVSLIGHYINSLLHGTGPLSSGTLETTSYVRLEQIAPDFVAREKAAGTYIEMAGPGAPHIEYLFLPCSYVSDRMGNHKPDYTVNNYTIVIILLNPVSRGSVTATTIIAQDKDGEEYVRVEPVLDPNVLSSAFDMRVMKEAVKFARKIGRHMQADPTMAGVEVSPGEDAVADDNDEAMEDYIRQEFASCFHPVGTCAMGPSTNPMAVVDNRLRVHGIDRLRVIDTSIMPEIISGHTCAPTVMIAEKASDMIKEDWEARVPKAQEI